tara:strand:- start:2302 stop:2562 length:261 start_codon:yes stop_codon:yes gene_type:complete
MQIMWFRIANFSDRPYVVRANVSTEEEALKELKEYSYWRFYHPEKNELNDKTQHFIDRAWFYIWYVDVLGNLVSKRVPASDIYNVD